VLRLRAILAPPEPIVPASALSLALVASALRRANLAPGAACAGFLWAAKDERRCWTLVTDSWSGRRKPQELRRSPRSFAVEPDDPGRPVRVLRVRQREATALPRSLLAAPPLLIARCQGASGALPDET